MKSYRESESGLFVIFLLFCLRFKIYSFLPKKNVIDTTRIHVYCNKIYYNGNNFVAIKANITTKSVFVVIGARNCHDFFLLR
jgi:hypothetical protein